MNDANRVGLSDDVLALLDDLDRINVKWCEQVALRAGELGLAHGRAMNDRCRAMPDCSEGYREALDLIFTFGPEMPVSAGSIAVLDAVLGRCLDPKRSRPRLDPAYPGERGVPLPEVVDGVALPAGVVDEWAEWLRRRLDDQRVHPVIAVALFGGVLSSGRAFGNRTLPLVLLMTTLTLWKAGYQFVAYCAIEPALVQAHARIDSSSGDSTGKSYSTRFLGADWVEALVRALHAAASRLDEDLRRSAPD